MAESEVGSKSFSTLAENPGKLNNASSVVKAIIIPIKHQILQYTIFNNCNAYLLNLNFLVILL
jgi:hypothetical protein